MKEPLKAYLRASHVEEPKECWVGVEVDELGSIMYEPRDIVLGFWIDHYALHSYMSGLWVLHSKDRIKEFDGGKVSLLDNSLLAIMKRSIRGNLVPSKKITSTEVNKWRTLRIMADALMYRSINPGVDIYYIAN